MSAIVFLSPSSIVPPHEVRCKTKLEKLTASMLENGWSGRPVLVFDVGRAVEALTGTHRIAAAKRANIDVPVIYVNDGIADFEDENGRSIIDASFFEADAAANFFREFGDDVAVDLMMQEHLEHENA